MKALISVFNKEGVADFAKELTRHTHGILSTGKTAALLKKNNIPVSSVSDYTGYPEMLNGRLKSLHPKIYAGLLADRSNKKHKDELTKHDIEPIDVVVVNLYPFREVVGKKNVQLHEAIENIDIGGVTLIRAAAKNFHHVLVIVDPSDYDTVIEAIKADAVTEDFRRELARKAFQYTAHYDTLINQYFNELEDTRFPDILNLTFDKIEDLRYGENKHQHGAAYREPFQHESSVANSKQLHGKQLSYNNFLDMNDALELVKDFKKPAAAIIKHTNPCGIAVRETIDDAYTTAHNVDTMSAFGSVVALNRPCTKTIADIVKDFFVEVIIAPNFEKDALAALTKKKNIRLMKADGVDKSDHGFDMKRIIDGLVVQTRHFPDVHEKDLVMKSKRKPTKQEIRDMLFAFKVCKHVKSNSIVFAKNEVAVGIGAGQMSRVDAVKIATFKANTRAQGAIMASDAFFPFRDGIDAAAKAGIAAVIQPGGSIRDKEVIDAVDEHTMAMMFTGVRLFKH